MSWTPLQPVDFEFTSWDTPQHNNLAELAFPYLDDKARAMMGAAHIPDMSVASWQLKQLSVLHNLMASGW